MKLPLVDKLGAITGVLSRLNPMALLAKIKGRKDGKEALDHSTSVILDDEEEDLFADLGDLAALDADIKSAEENAAATAAANKGHGDGDDQEPEVDRVYTPNDEESLGDAQALADLEAMPDFDEDTGDDDEEYDYDEDDDDEAESRDKLKKMAIFAGSGIAAAVVLGGLSWMIFGGSGGPDAGTGPQAQNNGAVFSLEGLPPPLKRHPSAALIPPQQAHQASASMVLTPKNDAGTFSGGTPIGSSGLSPQLADLGLDKVQQPGAGLVVPSTTGSSYASLTPWPPASALKAAPIANLVVQTDIGPLPMVAQDGNNSFDAYARPAPQVAPSVPQIAIVVTGLGVSRAATEAALKSMPSDVTFSLDIYARGLNFWMKKIRASGHEVLMELPSEPAHFPFDDPGPAALQSLSTLEENIQKLEYILSRTTGYYGVLAVYGGKFLTNKEQVTGILAQLKRRGLMYVDGGAEGSQGSRVADNDKMHWAAVEVNLDEAEGQAALLRQFTKLEAIAQKRSMAIARITPTPLSLKLLSTWLKSLEGKKMRLVPISALSGKQLIR